MIKQIFVHIGQVKCASSSIQEALSKCQTIDYVGVIPDENNHQTWQNPDFAKLFDRVLRFSCADAEHYKNLIQTHIEQSDKQTIVFSSENITLRFLPWDLPTHIKLAFLKKIFPEDTQFIYIYRQPVNLLYSLYKDCVMLGYQAPLDTFGNELVTFSDISFFNDLLIGKFLSKFNDFYELDRLHLFFLEDPNLSNKLEQRLKVQFDKFPYKNISPASQEIELIRQYNSKIHDFSSFFDIIELHKAYFDLPDPNIKYALSRKKLIRKDMIKTLKNYIEEPEIPKLSRQVLFKIRNDLTDTLQKYPSLFTDTPYLQNYIEEIQP